MSSQRIQGMKFWQTTPLWITEWKKLSHFDLKIESQAEIKFDPEFRVIFDIESQIDNLTLSIESIWLKYPPIIRNPEF